MATIKTAAKSPTPEQTRVAMTEIASMARTIYEINLESIQQLTTNADQIEESMRLLDMYLLSAQNLALTIGYIADAHGATMVRGGAEQWFMPPSYYWETRAAEDREPA